MNSKLFINVLLCKEVHLEKKKNIRITVIYSLLIGLCTEFDYRQFLRNLDILHEIRVSHPF